MKTSRMHAWTALAGIVVLLTVTLAFSQSGSTGHARRGLGLGFKLGMMSDYLDLTPAQQAQIKQVVVSEKPTLIPLVQQLVQSKQQMLQEVSSGAFDQAKITALANQESQVRTQLAVEKAKILSQVFNILTPDQKVKAVGFLQKRVARVESRLEKAQQKSSSE
jgi:Spy/CpxP family protein refolding chaperone